MSLFEEHIPFARKVASRFYFQGIDHDDLNQEALIALHKASQTWDRRCPFPGFADKVIRNRIIDMLQALKCRPIGVMEVEDDMRVSRPTEEIAEAHDDFRRLVAAWNELDDREIEIMRRSVLDEPYVDVAADLGMTVAAVKWNVWNVRRQLQEAA